MQHLIQQAIEKGGKLYPSISGGKDGQAMVKTLQNNGLPIEALIHADLGRIEWKESIEMCERQAKETGAPLLIARRTDGLGLIELWKRRMNQLAGQNKPFWSSSAARYCTSDTKRGPINKLLRNCGHNLVISCEGIRAGESKARAKKIPLEIRWEITSTYYKGMTVEEAIAAYSPAHRLALTWFPIFNMTTAEVWGTYGNTTEQLLAFRKEYKLTGKVNAAWNFHPAYVYGNERVSCSFCVLACQGDLSTGAEHHPEILEELIAMEDESGFTFKNGFSLRELKKSYEIHPKTLQISLFM